VKRLITIAFAVGLGGLIVAFLLTNPFFSIKEISYGPTNFVSKDKLSFYTENLMGKTIFCIYGMRDFKASILENNPAIQSLHFSAKWPSTVRVDVIEKSPWVTFLGRKKNIVVANDGTILNDEDSIITLEKIEDIIIIRGVPIESFTEKHIPDDLKSQLHYVIGNIKFYFPLTNLQMEFMENELILIKDDQLPIKIGTLSNLDVKFRNLKTYLEYADTSKKLTYIDIRLEDRIVVK
jgi:hypothetical protein